MNFERTAAAAVAMIWLTSGVASASIDAGVLIKKSPQLEQLVSHVLVGRLNAFHEVESVPGRYVAEIAVTAVEKGTGLVPGNVVYVRFTSPMTLAQLETERMVWDCGDQKVDPLPGEWVRIYTRLNQDYEYVADHPSCFFSMGRKAPLKSITDFLALRTALVVSSSLLIGFVVGFMIRSRPRSSTLQTVPART